MDDDQAVSLLLDQVLPLLGRRYSGVWEALDASRAGERRAEATGEIPLTLEPFLRRLPDDLEALVRGLEGEYEIVPVAIARDLQDRARSARRVNEPLRSIGDETQEEIKIYIREIREAGKDAAARDTDIADARLSVDKFLAAYPQHEEGLRLYLTGAELTSLARHRGVSVAALSKRKRKSVEAFGKWWDATRCGG